jgi:hypothetical protein
MRRELINGSYIQAGQYNKLEEAGIESSTLQRYLARGTEEQGTRRRKTSLRAGRIESGEHEADE